ncbi:MAG: general secretion pathway protein L [Alphaproteobacteria bacterium]|jgi:general secretion pathway protein L
MGVGATDLREGFGEFRGWWLGELSALMPKSLLRALQPANRTIAVTLDDDHITLTKNDGASSEVIGCYDTTNPDLDKIVAAHPSSRWQWGLYLGDDIVLRDLLRLPGAAIENYREAVEFQIELQTPFRRHEVFFDCRPLAPVASANLVGVEFIVARRDLVEAALQRLSAMGLSIDFVTATYDRVLGQAPFNLVAARSLSRRRQPARLNLVLVSLALLLAGLLVYLPMDRDRQTAATLSFRVDQLRTESRVAMRLREKINTAKREMLSVINRKRETPFFTSVLNDLTRLMPDGTWVSRLDFKDGVTRIVVHAPESGTIVRLIEGSEAFSDAKMVTAVRRKANSKREQFTLSFSGRGGEKQ